MTITAVLNSMFTNPISLTDKNPTRKGGDIFLQKYRKTIDRISDKPYTLTIERNKNPDTRKEVITMRYEFTIMEVSGMYSAWGKKPLYVGQAETLEEAERKADKLMFGKFKNKYTSVGFEIIK